MSQTAGGDKSSGQNLRPKPECMQDFLPLWNKRNAHVEAASVSRAKLEALRNEKGVATERLDELVDIAKMHDEEAVKLTEQMRQYQTEA